MRFRKPRLRRTGAASAVATLGALGVLGIGAAGASATTTQCSGADITGQGASIMQNAYQVFTPDFNTSTNAKACSGTQGTKGKPTVTYDKSSSGAGLASWGVGGGSASFGTGNAFVVTEEPPNATEKEEIENNESTRGSAPESLLTIPVLQESIAIIVHLPAECSVTSTEFPGRLVLGNATLQDIFLGTINTWSELGKTTSDEDGGDELTGSGCSSPITRVVREDSAGSTHILKKYLGLINTGEFATAEGQQTWDDLSEGPGNTVWPTAASVITPSKKGDAEEVAKVAATEGSIGYASLADARANGAFVPPPTGTGGKGEPTFWAPIQNNGTGLKKQKFQDPSTDADTDPTAGANCAKETYTNGQGTKFPPPSTQDSWSPVTTKTSEKNYPLCGIAYELSLTKFSAYPGTSQTEEITDANFLSFLLETKTGGGQALIAEHDYEALPSSLDSESNKGVKLIGY